MALSDGMRRIVRHVLDYALPPRCPCCGEIVAEDDRFCHNCWDEIEFLGEPCCARCGAPFDHVVNDEVWCGACLADPPPWDSARAAVQYGEYSRTIALRLKYGRRTGLARFMARYMQPHIDEAILSARSEAVIIPVPLHRWRLWGRGFNQSQLIAGHIGKASAIEVEPFALRRIVATRPLQDMSHRQREKTVGKAFAVDARYENRISGKIVILVDDVHTSGATARACTRVLLKAGARSVHLLCWARVLENHNV
ncbi:MAG: ComF family protein [Sphingobium sp.]|nr:ComF family protein [Sphingobium sp.]MCP5398892.1 ComF family protein [Sphingomonas sp.]